MKRWALMQGADCANVVEQETEPDIGGTWLDVTGLPVGPGFRLAGEQWLPPRVPVPQAVSMRQAKLALLAAGKLAAVDAAIEAMAEPVRTAARIEWSSAAIVDRTHPTVALLSSAAGLSEAELDELFVAASLIV